MITNCAANCGKKVIAKADGRAYLCKKCWRNLFDVLFKIILPASEPHLQLVTQATTTTEKEVA